MKDVADHVYEIVLTGNTLHIKGNVVFSNVVKINNLVNQNTVNTMVSCVDLAELENFDSSILALIVDLIRTQKRKYKSKPKIINSPALLLDLAKVCELKKIIDFT